MGIALGIKEFYWSNDWWLNLLYRKCMQMTYKIQHLHLDSNTSSWETAYTMDDLSAAKRSCLSALHASGGGYDWRILDENDHEISFEDKIE